MAQINCPDCDNKIDSEMEKCPFCGCPKKYFYREDEREVEKQVSYILGPAAIGYPAKGEEYAKLYGSFSKIANDAQDAFFERYDELGNIDNAISELAPQGRTLINKSIDDLIYDLNRRGIDITSSVFWDKYSLDFDFVFSEKIKDVKTLYADVLAKKASLDVNREISKANRMRWQGGGFGLKGALKGAVTAAALNVGADLLHAPGDAIRASKDKRIVGQEMSAIYKDDDIRDAFGCGIRECLLGVFDAYTSILESNGLIYKLPTSTRKAKEYYRDFKKISKSNFQDYSKAIFNCITKDPSNRLYWSYFLDIIANFIEDDVDGFMSFWNIEYLFPTFKEERALGKDFDLKWDKYKNKIGWVKGATPEAYVATRRFCLDYNNGDFDKELPKYSFRVGEFNAYYRDISYNRNNFMTWYDTIEWIPEGISIEEFLNYLRFERKGLPGSYLPNMWILGDGDYYFDDEDFISRLSCLRKMNHKDIYFVVDTSKNYNAINGLVLTKTSLVDINTQKTIPCSEVKNLELYTDDSIDIYGKKGARIPVIFPKDDRNHGASSYLERLIRVILVRYYGNENVRQDKMKSKGGNSVLIENSKTESIVYQEKNRNESSLENSQNLEIRNIDANEMVNEGEKSDTMFCAFCGKKIMRTAKFCNYCGEKNKYTIV